MNAPGDAMVSSRQLATTIDSRNGVASISLSGELDLATVPILERSLAGFEGEGVSAIMLDLRALTFIDSSGVHAFADARDRAIANGQELILVGATSQAERLFDITDTRFLLDHQDAAEVLQRFTNDGTSEMTDRSLREVDADVRLVGK